MVSFSFLSTSLLVGITLLSVYETASAAPPVPVIDVRIEMTSPIGYQNNCTAKEQKKLKSMIQKVLSKRFDKFYEQVAAKYALNDTVTEACLDSAAEDLPDRNLQQLQMGGSGWIYTKSYKCGYCDPGELKLSGCFIVRSNQQQQFWRNRILTQWFQPQTMQIAAALACLSRDHKLGILENFVVLDHHLVPAYLSSDYKPDLFENLRRKSITTQGPAWWTQTVQFM